MTQFPFKPEKLNVLQALLLTKIDELLEKLNINLYKSKKAYQGCCPVHGGNNSHALYLYYSGEISPGYWNCNTKHCESFFKRTIIGFTRGVLSHQKYGWTSFPEKDKTAQQQTVSFADTVNWCCELVGQKWNNIKYDAKLAEKMSFISRNINISSPLTTQKYVNRTDIRSKLQIPAEYFINRGWLPQTLDKYDVGLCLDETKPMYNRVVVPIYDNSGKYAIGFTGRSIFDKCLKCESYHDKNENCPPEKYRRFLSKWKNSDGFNREISLYNMWIAEKHIKNTGKAILCEGPGDIWRLHEAGIDCGLGIFGTNMTDKQQIILEMSGARELIILTNNDDAGKLGAEDIKKRLGKLYKLHFPRLETNDLGDMKPNEVKELLKSYIA